MIVNLGLRPWGLSAIKRSRSEIAPDSSSVANSSTRSITTASIRSSRVETRGNMGKRLRRMILNRFHWEGKSFSDNDANFTDCRP
jgi:hypothetical protein